MDQKMKNMLMNMVDNDGQKYYGNFSMDNQMLSEAYAADDWPLILQAMKGMPADSWLTFKNPKFGRVIIDQFDGLVCQIVQNDKDFYVKVPSKNLNGSVLESEVDEKKFLSFYHIYQSHDLFRL